MPRKFVFLTSIYFDRRRLYFIGHSGVNLIENSVITLGLRDDDGVSTMQVIKFVYLELLNIFLEYNLQSGSNARLGLYEFALLWDKKKKTENIH